ncbi:MAG: phosphatidylserine/phosphatidylglycerophosphate/cardiolipin synthase family protein [Deltaproteobacteria bacterium]|nr:phosphatidylserine/phosphatidylglycerophosphate/cardiolipin synthase family protein [Deltaproteobacteria bacterium]
MPAERNLADRISEVLRALTRESATVPAEAIAAAVTDPEIAPSRVVVPVPSEHPLDDAVRRVVEVVEQWRGGRSWLRFVQESGRDRIAALGFEVDLSVKVEALYRGGPDLADRTVRFAVDGTVVGEARTDERGLAHFAYVPTQPGLHRVTYEVLSDKGRVLRPLEPGEYGVLQVVTDQPVAAVDASLLLGAQGEALEPLRALARRGFQLCYVDLHDLDRTLDLRAIVEREELPRSATMVHPAEDLGFATLQVDFAPIFASSTLRRVRALGVPVVLAIVTPERVAAFEAVGGVTAVPWEEFAELAANDAALADLAARAAAMVRERDAARPEERFTRGLDLMTGSRVAEGNQVHVELDNRAAREAVFAALERAERSIHAQFYMLKEGRFAEQFAARLVVAARRGVHVRLVVDALYSGQELLGLQNPVAKSLSGEPDVEIIASDPITFAEGVDAVRLKQRDHRKLIVVDGRVAFVSGRNAGDEYYEGFEEVAILDATPQDRIPWLDAHLEVRGPLVAQVQRVFLENWRRNRGTEVAEDDGVPPRLASLGTTRARVIHHDGLADANALLSYEAIIHGARPRGGAQRFPGARDPAATMLRAVKRGVRIDFLTGCAIPRRADGTFFKGPIHRELFEYMTKRRFEPLIRGGVHVYEVQVSGLPLLVARGGAVRPYVHAKVITADGEVASVGSANLDATAAYWEREVNVVVEDAAVVGELEGRLLKLVATAVPLDLESEYWKRESGRRAITDTLWPDAMYS